MGLNKDFVLNALRTVKTPAGDRNIVDAGFVASVAACDNYASLRLSLPEPGGEEELARRADRAVRVTAKAAEIEVASLAIEFVDHGGTVTHRFGGQALSGQPKPTESQQRAIEQARQSQPHAQQEQGGGHRPISGLGQSKAPTPQDSAGTLKNVTHVVAVGAGKGGVGKSSVAVNLAVGLARKGHAVGLMDGDIYGPSLPTMLGLGSMEQAVVEGMLQPYLVHGIKAITIGKLVDPEKPLIWRGPMAHGAFKQLTEQTNWGELDYLIIDLPPGTGDVPLTMAQSLQLRGAVVVCTPQRVAQDDAVRATRMFQQLGIEVLGVVENMSYFVGDDGKEYDIFGRGGAEQMAQRLGVPFLGGVPISMGLRQASDEGDPTKNFEGEGKAGELLGKSLERMCKTFEDQVNLAAMRQGQTKPSFTVR